MEGLPVRTEDKIGSTVKRWTTTDWEQDDGSPSYIKNPRVIKTKVGDPAGNVRRTDIAYSAAGYGLVGEVNIYDDTAGTSILQKKLTTSYNLSSEYTSRRIIGLPSETALYDGNLALVSRVTYGYDEGGNLNDSALHQNIAPIQHDTAYNANVRRRQRQSDLNEQARCFVAEFGFGFEFQIQYGGRELSPRLIRRADSRRYITWITLTTAAETDQLTPTRRHWLIRREITRPSSIAGISEQMLRQKARDRKGL